MSRIASTTFSGAPTDNLAAVDYYNEQTDELRNSFISRLDEFGDNVLATIGRQNSALRDITDIALGKGVPDPKAAQRRLEGVLTGSRAAVGQLSDALQDGMLATLGVDERNTQELKAVINNTATKIQAGSVTDARGVVSLLEDVTDTQGLINILDIEAQASVFSGILQEVNRWGVPDTIDQVMDNLDDEDLQDEVVRRSATNIRDNADIDTLERYVDRGERVVNTLLAEVPDMAQRTVSRYRFPRDTTPANYPDRLTQLVKVLTAFQDNWWNTSVGSTPAINLGVINQASDDALVLFRSDAAYRDTAMIADQYPKENVKTLLRSFYPQSAVTDGT